jgi:hypothetical protein
VSRSRGLVGHEFVFDPRGYEREVDRRPRYGSVPSVVKCGRLFMAGQSGARRVIHSSDSLSTSQAPPV